MWKKDPYFPRVRERASPDVITITLKCGTKMLTGCHVTLILRELQKNSNYFQMRIFLSFSHVEREECPNFINLKYVLALNFLLPMDAHHPAEKERMKKKNTEWKWATESLASGVGGRWKSYCPPVHYKNQLRVFAFLCGFLMLWIGGGKNLMFIIILMKINTYSM